MWLKTGSHCVGVGLMSPAIILMVLFSCASILCTCGLFSQTGGQYSAVEKTRPSAEERRVEVDTPQVVPHSFGIMLFLEFSFSALDICSLKDSVLSRVTPRYLGVLLWVSRVFSNCMLSSLLASLLFR